MELRDAYDQISVIHAQLAATERLRGLRDLDTGEIFVTDERRLLHA